jgi:hypothetical protein
MLQKYYVNVKTAVVQDVKLYTLVNSYHPFSVNSPVASESAYV